MQLIKTVITDVFGLSGPAAKAVDKIFDTVNFIANILLHIQQTQRNNNKYFFVAMSLATW